MAAQLTSTKGPSCRADWAWMARATSSLPTPFWPWISTRPLGGAARRHGVALALRPAPLGRLDRAPVVDDEDVLGGHDCQAGTAAVVRAPGSSITKRLPRGGLSSTQIVPPWSVTIWCTIGSPS